MNALAPFEILASLVPQGELVDVLALETAQVVEHVYEHVNEHVNDSQLFPAIASL